MATSEHGTLRRHKREWVVDGNWVSTVDLSGPSVWVQLELAGGDEAPEVDRVDVEARVESTSPQPENWTVSVLGSDEGRKWTEVGQASGMARAGGDIFVQSGTGPDAPQRPLVAGKLDQIDRIMIETQEAGVRIIDKTGPLATRVPRQKAIFAEDDQQRVYPNQTPTTYYKVAFVTSTNCGLEGPLMT